MAFAATTGFGDNYINPFAVALGASNFQIGLLTSVSQLVPAITQLKAADVTERVGSRKKIVVRSVFLQACMLLPIAMVFFLPRSFQVIALICFYALYVSFASFAGPAWGSLMANLVPEGKRGAFFSKRGRLISQITVISSFLAGYILNLFEKESLIGFTAIFLLAMVSRFISCYFLWKDVRAPFGGETGALLFLYRICAKVARRKFWKIRYLPLLFSVSRYFWHRPSFLSLCCATSGFLTLRTP